jgi:ABC-2 type transport system permease protein
MSAATAVLRVEAKLFLRESGFLFWVVGFPVVLLVIIGLVPSFREPADDQGGRSVVDLYVPVTVLLALITAGIMAMPSTLAAYREQGILRRLRTTPVGPTALLVAQVVVLAVSGLLSALLVLVVGRAAYGTPLPEDLAGYTVAVLLALVAALSLGALITAASPTTKVASALASAAYFSSMFTAGVWVPVQAMPGLLRDVVSFTPMGAASEALNQATTGTFPDLVHLLVVAAWSVVLGWAAVRSFRWE